MLTNISQESIWQETVFLEITLVLAPKVNFVIIDQINSFLTLITSNVLVVNL